MGNDVKGEVSKLSYNDQRALYGEVNSKKYESLRGAIKQETDIEALK